MPSSIYIATRGSTLALAQSNAILAQCRSTFPQLTFELKIIKTTGDKLQTASLAKEGESLPKGLFTKELEGALLAGEADFAVHSLKDLPTELPAGLKLGAVGRRADVRDVLIYRGTGHAGKRGFAPGLAVTDLPQGATIGTSSTRRKAQLLALRPDLNIIDHRGNVLTRIEKLADRAQLDAIMLAAAGLGRLHFQILSEFPGDEAAIATSSPNHLKSATPISLSPGERAGVRAGVPQTAQFGKLCGEGIPAGLLATILEVEAMLPCVGQGAVGIETRKNDARIAAICAALNHDETEHCVTAERAFLAAMGGGCQSPVGAYAEIIGGQIRLRAVSFRDGPVKRGEAQRPIKEAAELGRELADRLK